MLVSQIRSHRSSLAALGDSVVNAILSISEKREIWFLPVRELRRVMCRMQNAVC